MAVTNVWSPGENSSRATRFATASGLVLMGTCWCGRSRECCVHSKNPIELDAGHLARDMISELDAGHLARYIRLISELDAGHLARWANISSVVDLVHTCRSIPIAAVREIWLRVVNKWL